MTHTITLPTPVELVADPIHTSEGVRHVTGQTLDLDGLVAVHPELSSTGFTGRWQITNVLTGRSITAGESSVWLVRRELTRAGGEW